MVLKQLKPTKFLGPYNSTITKCLKKPYWISEEVTLTCLERDRLSNAFNIIQGKSHDFSTVTQSCCLKFCTVKTYSLKILASHVRNSCYKCSQLPLYLLLVLFVCFLQWSWFMLALTIRSRKKTNIFIMFSLPSLWWLLQRQLKAWKNHPQIPNS